MIKFATILFILLFASPILAYAESASVSGCYPEPLPMTQSGYGFGVRYQAKNEQYRRGHWFFCLSKTFGGTKDKLTQMEVRLYLKIRKHHLVKYGYPLPVSLKKFKKDLWRLKKKF